MPNHVTHRMRVTGPKEAIDAFDAKFISRGIGKNWKDEDVTYETLDFERLIPMPEIIRNSESSSVVSYGLTILGRTDISGPFDSHRTLEQMLEFPWVKKEGVTTTEELKKMLLRRWPDAIEKAEIAIKAYEETGHADWYSWSIENWGTKWNCYNCTVNRVSDIELLVIFDTAWSSPMPVFNKMAQMLDDGLTVTVHGFDEGWGFATIGVIVPGLAQVSEVDATDELYEIVYGEAPEHYDEEGMPL